MKTPTEENFRDIFRQIEAAQGALVGMINFLLTEKKPNQEKSELTNTEKYELLSFFKCPDCHGPNFLKGPEAAMCTNIACEDCGSRFNICPPYYAARI